MQVYSGVFLRHRSIKINALSLLWRYNGRDCVLNHQPQKCLLNCLFIRRSNKTSKLRVTGLFAENSPGTGEFPAQMASNVENIFIWWRHHVIAFYNIVFCYGAYIMFGFLFPLVHVSRRHELITYTDTIHVSRNHPCIDDVNVNSYQK